MLFQYYICKFFAALNFYQNKWAYSLALCWGFMVGQLPANSGLLILAFLVLAFSLPINYSTMFLVALVSRFLRKLLLPFQIDLGNLILESPVFYELFRLSENLPLLPWLGLARAEMIGAIILGLGIGFILAILGTTLLYRIALLIKPLFAWLGRRINTIIASVWEAHFPNVKKLLLPTTGKQKWYGTYCQAKDDLQLAETSYKQAKQRQREQPDFY